MQDPTFQTNSLTRALEDRLEIQGLGITGKCSKYIKSQQSCLATNNIFSPSPHQGQGVYHKCMKDFEDVIA